LLFYINFAKVQIVKRIIYIANLFLLLGVFGSCAKLQQKKEYFLNQEFKKYFKFGAQSSWNYVENGGSSTAASMELNTPKEGILDLGEVKQEFFSYELNGTGTKNMLLRAVADEDKISRMSLFVSDTTYKVIVELFYLDGVFTSYAGRNDVLIEHASKEINGKTYSDVIELQLNENEFYEKVFFAAQVGIIALEEKSSRDLFLNSYILK